MLSRLVVVMGLCLIAPTGWLIGARLTAPSDGTVVQLSNEVWQQERIRVHSVLDPHSGLRPGDQVLAIDGRPVTGLHRAEDIVDRAARDGETLTYTVRRDGEKRDVRVRMAPFAAGAFLSATWASALTVLVLLAVAWFVFAHRPEDPAARILLMLAALCTTGSTAWLLGDQVVRLATQGPGLPDLFGECVLCLVWGAAAHFAMVVPGSGLVVTRARTAVLYAAPFALHGVYLAVILPGADGPLETAGRVVQMSLMPSLVMPPAAAVLMWRSYRTAVDEVSRQRLRWVHLTFAATMTATVGLWGLPMLWGRAVLSENLLPLALVPTVLALAAAVLRYRLFDIEIIVRRSLVYGGLTICVLTVYLTAASMLGHAIGAGTGLVTVLATCLVALSAKPLDGYLRHRFGRLLYGERDDPFEVVSRLGRVDVAVAPEAVLQEVVAALTQALRLPYAAIQLRNPQGVFVTVAVVGRSRNAPSVIPLAHLGEEVGRLHLGTAPGQEPFGPADRRLLDAVTRQVSSAASTVLLNSELRRARERLVLAREEERRRMQLRLQDGLEPSLAARARELEMINSLAERDPIRAAAALDTLIAGTRAMISEVRAVVIDLRPPALDQLGLAGAIRERAAQLADPAGAAQRPLPVTVEQANAIGPLPAAVEVAAFWIATEMVRHIAQSATATACRVVLSRHGDVVLEVHHDGAHDETAPDDVLASAQERAAELGGSLTIGGASVGGTVVRARLPIRSGGST
jgi:two-component system, NarL family, sensor kinase